MNSKKILLIIVEGISDQEALGYILSNLFDNDEVKIQITNGDITTRLGTTPMNILSKIGDTVKLFAGDIYKAKDFSEIVHIIDMDGAFIPDSNIMHRDEFSDPYYDDDKILTNNIDRIKRRNQQKRDNINRLLTEKKVWKSIPYSMYFFSANLDHVLYGNANLQKYDKVIKANEFSKIYYENTDRFVEDIYNLSVYNSLDYNSSWNEIRKDIESLKKNTNFHLFFTGPKNENSFYMTNILP